MNLRITIWNFVGAIYPTILRKIHGMDLGEKVCISYKARIDRNINPHGIHIGDRSWVLGGAIILAHDYCRSLKADTFIGSDSIIGARSIILPGVRIGNQVVIGAGAVVTHDIPDNSLAVGNPAKVVKTGIKVYNGKILYNEE